MRYRVEWILSARDQLAEAWIESGSELREAITTAAGRMERQLSLQPYEAGESREFNERVYFVEPLIVRFAIDDLAHVVIVLDLAVYEKRR